MAETDSVEVKQKENKAVQESDHTTDAAEATGGGAESMDTIEGGPEEGKNKKETLPPIALPYPCWSTPFNNEVELEKHIKDDTNALPGSCGLYNLGNTCFMNAGLQCLLANTNFMKFFLEIYHPDEGSETLTTKFAELSKLVWSSNYVQIHPKFFKETLGHYHPQFQNYRQHDCQEFLALILDDLHEELNQSKIKHHAILYSRREGSSSGEQMAAGACLEDDVQSDVLEAATNQSDTSDHEDQSSHSVSPVEPQLVSEESNQSAGDAVRFKSLPQNVEDFKSTPAAEDMSLDQTDSPSASLSNIHSILQKSSDLSEGSINFNTQCISPTSEQRETNDSFKFERNFTSLPSTSKQNLNIHTIEEFYMKETKTKNVNVLASEFMEEEIKTDSEKFPRQEILSASSTNLIDEMIDIEMYEEAAKDDYKSDENINVLPVERKGAAKTGATYRKSLKCELDPDESGINNIKRIKIDEDQKNFKLEQLQKVNTDKNPVRERSCGAGALEDGAACCSAPAVDGGALYQSPVMKALMEKQANQEWEKYLDRNWSIIVDTFQGQYRNMVVCSSCHHVSMTYEPFMYLTVPLPHAMEKQISVVVKFNSQRPPLKVLVTTSKNGNIGKFRQELLKTIAKENLEGDIVLAEVYENHISRLLEDHFLIRYLRERRTVYAFEMGPAPITEDFSSDTFNNSIKTTQNDITSGCQIAGPIGTSLDDNDDDLFSLDDKPKDDDDDDDFAVNPLFHDSDDDPSPCADKDSLVLNNMMSAASDTSMTGTYEIGYWNNDVSSTSLTTEAGGGAGEKAGCSGTSEQWKSCTICLEEMTDSDLMVHTSCGGTLCQSCLEMSIKHYGEMAFSCPVCSLTVDPTEEYVPLSSGYKPKIRILTIPVVFRHDYMEDGKNKSELFGHPALAYFPNCLTGKYLSNLLDKLLPFEAKYKILLVDGQGLHCSRCLYHDHCRGCVVDTDNDINILPGDHLALCVSELTDEQRAVTSRWIDDASLGFLRPNHPLTLYDCLRAFTQSEVLDEQNPWFCPRCRINQRANKTISLWRYPDWVIIYLKRFVFHDLSSSKIDNKVIFPLEDLDLHDYLSGPVKKELLYDLKGCVCHFGGVNSGHYTSYTKHPVTDTWHYYNDETVTVLEPQAEDYANAYILFYQRKGSSVDLDINQVVTEDIGTMPGPIQLHDEGSTDAKLDFYS